MYYIFSDTKLSRFLSDGQEKVIDIWEGEADLIIRINTETELGFSRL